MKLFLTLFFFSTSILLGQTKGTITGKVIDKLTREPLPGVNILVIDTNIGDATKTDGSFRIGNIEVGTYRVRASFVGYNSIVKTDVVVNPAKENYIEFELIESSIELDGITVTSDYFDLDQQFLRSLFSDKKILFY